MKFLHISDLHIGKRVNEFSMIEDQKYILRQIKEIALEKQVDAVMIAGDIYDKPVPSARRYSCLISFSRDLLIAGKRCLQSVEIVVPRNVLHLVHSL